MATCKYLMMGWLVINGFFSSQVCSQEFYSYCDKKISSFDSDTEEENLTIFIQPTDNLEQVLDYAKKCFFPLELQEQSAVYYELAASKQGATLTLKKNFRDYNLSVTKKEKQDISEIIKALSQKSLLSLAASRSELKKIGNRIDHLHPLRFLSTLLTSEELKTGLHKIRERGWVWEEFSSDLVKNLDKEHSNNNLKEEYLADFAKRVGIDLNEIKSPIHNKAWKQFIDLLIDRIPREKTDRYKI